MGIGSILSRIQIFFVIFFTDIHFFTVFLKDSATISLILAIAYKENTAIWSMTRLMCHFSQWAYFASYSRPYIRLFPFPRKAVLCYLISSIHAAGTFIIALKSVMSVGSCHISFDVPYHGDIWRKSRFLSWLPSWVACEKLPARVYYAPLGCFPTGFTAFQTWVLLWCFTITTNSNSPIYLNVIDGYITILFKRYKACIYCLSLFKFLM